MMDVDEVDVSAKIINDLKRESVSVDPNYWLVDTIPTKYKFYPEGTKIYARSLNVMEVKKLTSINSSNSEVIVNDILKRAIKGISIDEIFLVDKFYLLLYLRASTFRNPEYVVDFDCNICEKKDAKFHFNLENLNVDFVKDDVDYKKKIKLTSGDEISFRFLKISDQNEMNSFKTKYEQSFGNSIDEEMIHVACSLDMINGEKKSLYHRFVYVTTAITAEDFADIASVIRIYSVGVNPVMRVTCGSCGGVSEILIPFRDTFFLPERQNI